MRKLLRFWFWLKPLKCQKQGTWRKYWLLTTFDEIARPHYKSCTSVRPSYSLVTVWPSCLPGHITSHACPSVPLHHKLLDELPHATWPVTWWDTKYQITKLQLLYNYDCKNLRQRALNVIDIVQSWDRYLVPHNLFWWKQTFITMWPQGYDSIIANVQIMNIWTRAADRLKILIAINHAIKNVNRD